MEIKKGISQMTEYPNQEINYVISSDGKMYYVLKDGALDNGVIIATLDPKRAIDDAIKCESIGAFNKDGSVLIDFNKSLIKRIDEKLLLVVNSKPLSKDVIDAKSHENDEISKSIINDNKSRIIDKMNNEMGITGEMLFSDSFGEANVYSMDSYNNKIGIDCSFIGRNSRELYFHTNNVNSDSKIITLDITNTAENNSMEIPKVDEIPDVEDINNITNDVDLKLDINKSVLDGFKPMDEQIQPDKIEIEEDAPAVDEEITTDNEKSSNDSESDEEEVVEEKTAEEISEEMHNSAFSLNNDIEDGIDTNATKEEEISDKAEDEEVSDYEDDENKNANNDQVLDNVIEVMRKMIEETNKLNERINELEKEVEEKNKMIEEQESKKTELNDLLDQANEVLENID